MRDQPYHSPVNSPRPTPLDDVHRLQALRDSGLLDTPAEEEFDRVTRLATRILDVPVALVSLVDHDRQFFKSCIGLPEPWATRRETPLSHSFCQHTVTTGAELVITDARRHPELRHNLAVPDLGVIAYAGIPLVTTDGAMLGSFCVIDTKPRQWSTEDLATLRDLAAIAASEIELRLTIAAQRRAVEEQRIAEREAHRHDALYRTLARHFPNGAVILFDHELRYLIADGLGLAAVGLDRVALEGRTLHELFPRDLADHVAVLMREALNGREAVGDIAFGGRSFVARAVPVKNEPGGAPLGLLVTQDVTLPRQSERRLQLLAESGRLLSSSLDLELTLGAVARLVAPELADLVVIDLVEDGVIRRVTTLHADPSQAAAAERTKDHAPQLGDAGPQAQALRERRSVVLERIDDDYIRSTGRGEDHVQVLRMLDASSGLVVPLLIGDEALGTLSLVRTSNRPAIADGERELAEELARRAALAVQNARLYDEARRATRARDHMLGVVSHDLRNPIHTIFMSASFVQDILPPDDASGVMLQAKVIKRSAERANRLIGDLMDVTRLESGRLALDRRRHSAAALVDEALDAARLPAAERGIELRRGAVDDALSVLADRDRILQALGNLVANAFKFTPKEGKVTLAVSPEGSFACFSVSDTGPGIAPTHVPHLFEQFWQVNPGDKRGVGLGLSIVRGIAEGHGGEARVTTSLGEGSCFSVLVPLAT
jgi:signal transduction histidine kinase